MSFVCTLVASDAPLSIGLLKQFELYCADGALSFGVPRWLEPHKAVDFPLATMPDTEQVKGLRKLLADGRIDFFVQPMEERRKKLLLADMDSTIITAETLDELAAHAGAETGAKIAEITERAMRGEIDFSSALRQRVMMLKGLPESALEKTRAAIEFNPGARTLVRTMRDHGATCVLVSGGFTFFTGWVTEEAGFHAHHSNVFDIANGALSGQVLDPVLDKEAKLYYLNDYAARRGMGLSAALTIGDGSNDLPMLQAAGLGIGYHPKPLLREALNNCILYGDLTAALYAQGYKTSEFSSL